MANNNQIKCPHCNKLFEPSEAFQHQLEEKLLGEERKKQKQLLERTKKETEEKVIEKAKTEYEELINRLKKDSQEEKERNQKLIKQLESLSDEMRSLRRKDEERGLEMKKTLASQEEKIRQEASKKAQEEQHLKIAEKEKQLRDAVKVNEELRRRLQQGSQQTQGEVLELAIEERLKKEFPTDKIEEVKKGQRGADVIQEVIDKRGKSCGVILWETKNAQWSEGWIAKLREDQRQAKADLAILVSENLPEEITTFAYRNGIWVTSRKLIIPLALALRFDLVRINFERQANVGKNEKTEILYRYITSTEFKHRVEAISEAFGNLQNEAEREKRWFNTKWARQEKELRKVLDHTHGMYGDLQGMVGKALPDMKSLELKDGL